jgi:hypothetical protein
MGRRRLRRRLNHDLPLVHLHADALADDDAGTFSPPSWVE